MLSADSSLILSIIGPHATEGQDSIVQRKLNDIRNCGHTFWFFKATQHCDVSGAKQFGVSKVLFLAPKMVNGAKDTKNTNQATEYSPDGIKWIRMDSNLSEVTGKIQKQSTCFHLKDLIVHEKPIQHDLNQYISLNGGIVKFDLTKSTQIVSFNASNKPLNEPQPRQIILTGILDKESPLVYVR